MINFYIKSFFKEILVNMRLMPWIWPPRDINLSIFLVSESNDFNKTTEKHLLLSDERINPQKFTKNNLLTYVYNKFESKHKHWRKYWKNVDLGKYM
jgi:hypothetical protein